MPETLDTRLAAFAASLRDVGAIRSDAIEQAFATIERHRCVPRFRYGPKTISVPSDRQPGADVLDIVYSHQSLLTSTGGDDAPPSSSSAPTLMARMLEALDLQPGMRVLEIGAGTGYNAALIAAITGSSVVTIDADVNTTQGAAESIHRLGLDHQVAVRHGDGYLGEPSGAPYDRIIVTCGVAGLSPQWLDQLTPDGLIVAPIAHGGVHPIVVVTNSQGIVRGNAVLWADFMPAFGPLRPAELVGHNPADYILAAPLTRIPDVSSARTTAAYNDLWFFLATRDSRITRAYTVDDSVDPSKGACALHAPARGTAWVQTDRTVFAAGESTVAEELCALLQEWDELDQPPLTGFTCTFDPTPTPGAPLWVPHYWVISAGL
ncbi:MAG: protein-L-isoaspartate O-methyltransferase family protein [Pseudonocardiales bacterium]